MSLSSEVAPKGPVRWVASMIRAAVASPLTGLGGAALLWSGNFVVARALRGEVSPVSLNFWRWSIALAILLPLAWKGLKQHRRLILRHWRLLALLGLTGIACFHTAVYLALAKTSAVNALLLLSLARLLISALSWAMLGERLTPLQLAGVAIAFAGAVALIARGSLALFASFGLRGGDAWMLLAVGLWAAYSLLLKRLPAELPQLVVLTATCAAAVALMLPLYACLAPNEHPLSLGWQVRWGILYVAVFASVAGFMLWNRGVSVIGPSRAAAFIYLMPAFGAALAVALLGETLHLYQLASGVLILVGISAMNWKRRARANPQAPPVRDPHADSRTAGCSPGR